jgi:hypothetical protein
MYLFVNFYRAKKFRDELHKKHEIEPSLAMIVKQRSKPGEIERMDLVGSVQDADAIIGICKPFSQIKHKRYSKLTNMLQLMTWLTLLVLYARQPRC